MPRRWSQCLARKVLLSSSLEFEGFMQKQAEASELFYLLQSSTKLEWPQQKQTRATLPSTCFVSQIDQNRSTPRKWSNSTFCHYPWSLKNSCKRRSLYLLPPPMALEGTLQSGNAWSAWSLDFNHETKDVPVLLRSQMNNMSPGPPHVDFFDLIDWSWKLSPSRLRTPKGSSQS